MKQKKRKRRKEKTDVLVRYKKLRIERSLNIKKLNIKHTRKCN